MPIPPIETTKPPKKEPNYPMEAAAALPNPAEPCSEKRRGKKLFEYICAAAIFAMTLIDLISSTFMTDNVAVITDHGDYYLTYYYPLFNTLIMCVIGLFFLLKAFLFRSCTHTKVISATFFGLQITTLFQMFNLDAALQCMEIWKVTLNMGIIIVILLWVLQAWSDKLKKTMNG